MTNPRTSNADFISGLPSSGLELLRESATPQYFDTAGHRAVVIGEEGGAVEVWTYPFKAVKSLEFLINVDGKQHSSKDMLRSFRVRPEASIATLGLDGVEIDHIVFAPVGVAAAVFVLNVKSQGGASVSAQAQSDLKLMWPADSVPRSAVESVDPQTQATVVTAPGCVDAAAFGWHGVSEVPGGCEEGQVLVYVVAGSDAGSDEALKLWRDCGQNWRELYAQTVDYYTQLLSDSARLESSDPDMDKAFQWAIVGMDKCYMRTPGVGSGFVAGFNRSDEGGRPGFGWYFGRDSSWTGFAVNDYGDFSKVADNIRLLARYQITEGGDTGKIFHELSAAHEREAGMEYAYPAADATPFFVIDIANYYNWTADSDFVREMWPCVLKAMDWCYRMDVDGDLLVDNPPAGHQWYDHGEKNMIDMVAIWCKALFAASELADVLSDPRAEKWRLDAERVREIINQDFWNEKNSYLFDRKLPDNSMLDITTANPTIPLLWGLVNPAQARRAVSRMMQEDLSVAWGLRTNSNLDSIYSPTGYHEGTVWPLTTGWGALAAFANGFADAGWHHLKAVASLTEDFCLGYITEVLLGDKREPAGCPHQAWSEAMVVLPVVEGIFGVRPYWPSRALTVSVQLPAELKHAALRNLSIGNARIEIEARQTAQGVRLSVGSDTPGIALTLSPVVPQGCVLSHVALDDRALSAEQYQVVDLAGPSMAVVQHELMDSVELELKWIGRTD